MRSIKFRVWDKQFNKWVEPDVVHICAATGEAKGKRGGSGYVDTWELMQYTGLKDKNGKEIYEGDVVQQHKGRAVVTYQAPSFVMKHSLTSKSWFTFIVAPEENQFEEVIGNIHENPELVTTNT